VVISRRAVLDALYQQGVRALRREDYCGAIDALQPVVEEARAWYPDASAHLETAQRRADGAPLVAGRPA
jgi:hypothetical protein